MRGLPRRLSDARRARAGGAALLLALAVLGPARDPAAGAVAPARPAGVAGACPAAGAVGVVGRIAIDGIDEVSGVVAGRRTEGLLWVQEDSGNPARIWGVDDAGDRLASVRVAGSVNLDWEDLALARGRLWIADIGDNLLIRPTITVYSFPEPAASVRRVRADALTLTYPDGPHNAEALFVDGVRRQLFVVTKEAGVARVFRARLPVAFGGPAVELRPVARLPLNRVTAADLGPAGVVLKAGSAFLYPWTADRRVASALAGEPCELPVGPGESLGFTRSPAGLVAIPEGPEPSIYLTPVAR